MITALVLSIVCNNDFNSITGNKVIYKLYVIKDEVIYLVNLIMEFITYVCTYYSMYCIQRGIVRRK